MNIDQHEREAAATQPDTQPDEVNPDRGGDTVNPQSPTEFPPGREDIDEPQPDQPDIAPSPLETPPPPD